MDKNPSEEHDESLNKEIADDIVSSTSQVEFEPKNMEVKGGNE